MRTWIVCSLLAITLGCGRDEPVLFSVVRTSADAPDACLPLREPALGTVASSELARLRPPDDHYVWLVGETVEGPRGMQRALAAFTGRAALVSLTSSVGGKQTTRAVATIDGADVTHTYFGTPLTPAFPNEPGAALTVTFDAHQIDRPALAAAQAALAAVPAEGAGYASLLSALTPDKPRGDKPEGMSQTWVLRDPASCGSGACRAAIVEQRLVVLSPSAGATAHELATTLCLKGGRLHDRDGDDHDGAYAVVRLAHARLPDEALGDEFSTALAALARCDREFGPELATRVEERLARAELLRPEDRELLRTFSEDATFATRAASPEARLEASTRLAASSAQVCAGTSSESVACARAKAVASCAAGRAMTWASVAPAWSDARRAVQSVESATQPDAACAARAASIVELSGALTALAGATRALRPEASCAKTEHGLSCDAFPELSRRSKAALADAQDLLYRQCYCGALVKAESKTRAGRLVRAGLRCDVAPESFVFLAPVESPLTEEDVAQEAAERAGSVPALTAAQCPSCPRLARRLDDELARGIALGRSQAAVAKLLRGALAPVGDLHDRAFALASGDTGVRCARRPDEWAVIVRALSWDVAPRDLFRDGGGVDPAKLESRLAEASLLRSSLDGLPCARDVEPEPVEEPAPLFGLPSDQGQRAPISHAFAPARGVPFESFASTVTDSQ